MPSTVPDGLWVDNNVDAGEFRKALGVGLVLPGGAGAVPRPGRLIGPSSAGTVPLQVTPTGPASMAVLVKAGKAITYRSAAYGPIVGVGPDGDVTIPIPAAPASGSQWHRVYLIQRDTAAPASDSAAGAVVDLVSGTAASTPVAPTVPTGGLLLADVIVPAGALTVTAAYITDRPIYTAPRGGILPVANQAERVALQTAGLVWPTLEVLELDNGRRLWHDGTRFRYAGDRTTVANAATDLAGLTAYVNLRALDTSTAVTWRYDGATWWPTTEGQLIAGKMWRTSAYSSVMANATEYPVEMQVARVTGGVTFDSVNYALTVPADGLYDLDWQGYLTGGAAAVVAFWIRRVRSGVANATVASKMMDKINGSVDDQDQATARAIPLKAGDKLVEVAYQYAGPVAYYGTSEVNGCSVALRYVAPLGGATPL